jgi:RND family efflux transporter MFP subunit
MNIQPMTLITGKLQPARKASLRFEVSGSVLRRTAEPGQRVAAGESLLQIEDGDFIDLADEASAFLAEEKNAITRDKRLLELLAKERELLKRELQRLERLGQESLASKSNYDQALQRLLKSQADETRLKHSVDTANTRVKTRRAILNRAYRDLERTKLLAPFDGTVNSVFVEIGDYVTAGQKAIDLVQLDKLDLYLEVTGGVMNQLTLGQAVNVFVDDKKVVGEIIAIAADPDPTTHTHALRIRMTSDGLYPGKLGIAELPGGLLSNAHVVPLTSILREEGQTFIFKVENDRAVRHPIALIKRHNEWQVITGINPGTQIIARDVTTLADGQEITIE